MMTNAPAIRDTVVGKTLLATVDDCDGETLLQLAVFADEFSSKVRRRLDVKAELDRSLFQADFGVCDYD